jgi:hypothetical protein
MGADLVVFRVSSKAEGAVCVVEFVLIVLGVWRDVRPQFILS